MAFWTLRHFSGGLANTSQATAYLGQDDRFRILGVADGNPLWTIGHRVGVADIVAPAGCYQTFEEAFAASPYARLGEKTVLVGARQGSRWQ